MKKIKKPLSDIIFSQNGMRQAEKERKKFYSRIPFILDPDKKIPKKYQENCKKFKNLFLILFLAKTGWDRPRKWEKILLPSVVHTWPQQDNSEENSKKIQKIKKPTFRQYF